jgi:hypothetical protein
VNNDNKNKPKENVDGTELIVVFFAFILVVVVLGVITRGG